jgi:hypothetical protein
MLPSPFSIQPVPLNQPENALLPVPEIACIDEDQYPASIIQAEFQSRWTRNN